jgi:hypothetical protein
MYRGDSHAVYVDDGRVDDLLGSSELSTRFIRAIYSVHPSFDFLFQPTVFRHCSLEMAPYRTVPLQIPYGMGRQRACSTVHVLHNECHAVLPICIAVE